MNKEDLLALITDEEREMIADYIDFYAVPEDGYSGRTASIPYILREWASSKEWLCEVFGGQLILSEDITYNAPEAEVFDKLCSDNAITDFSRYMMSWARSQNWTWDKVSYFSRLFNPSALYSSEYDGETIEIDDPSRPGKTIKITRGCKPMRVIGKIYNLYANHIDEKADFEAFRIAVSMALNTATVKGKLCLSIHPLDYMTMSDNDCGWDSCMSWKNYGSYRQGTVEMMNSDCVVVAYIASKDDMKLCGRHKWSNKKWRSLYIVTNDFITNIKGYPYQVAEVDRIIVEKLSKMVSEHDGETFTFPFEYNANDTYLPGTKVMFNTRTHYMYNDFGTLSTNYGALNVDLNNDSDPYDLHINYSGRSECMLCGEVVIYTDNEGLLACQNCYSESTCDECGEYVPESDLYETGDGTWVCETCLSDYYTPAINDGLYHRYDNMAEIYILPDFIKEHEDEVKIEDIYSPPSVFDNYYGTIDLSEEDMAKYYHENYLKEGREFKTYQRNRWSGTYYYVYESDLNDRMRRKIDNNFIHRFGCNFYEYAYYNTELNIHNHELKNEWKNYLRSKAW